MGPLDEDWIHAGTIRHQQPPRDLQSQAQLLLNRRAGYSDLQFRSTSSLSKWSLCPATRVFRAWQAFEARDAPVYDKPHTPHHNSLHYRCDRRIQAECARMAPSEESILSNFLLSPAPLPTVLSLQKFTELFPKRLRNHPHIRALYRELQQVREHDMDRVNENIDQEIQRGEQQKAELRKAALAAGVEANSDEQREIDLDLHLFDQGPGGPEDYHTVPSLLAAMERACTDIEAEIASIDHDADQLMKELQATVGNLSDLRYGKLQGPAGTANNVADEAIKGLQILEDACYEKAMGSET